MVRTRRKAKGLSLREAAQRMGLDPGNLSKVERGLWKPPMSAKIVLRVQHGLELGGEDGKLLHLLAAIENGRLPQWVKDDEQLLRDVAIYVWKRRK